MQSLLSKLWVASCLLGALMLVLNVAEGQEGKRKKKGNDPTAKLKSKLAEANLPPDLLEKANKIVDEHAPKLREAQAKVDAVLTDDQKAARREAQRAAKQAGKKGKEAAADVEAALKLTDEQKAKMADAQKDVQAAQQAMNAALREILSDEQEADLGIKGKKKKKAA